MEVRRTKFTVSDYETLYGTPLCKLSDFDLLQIVLFDTEAIRARGFAIELLMRLEHKQSEKVVDNKALEALKVLKEFLK